MMWFFLQKLFLQCFKLQHGVTYFVGLPTNVIHQTRYPQSFHLEYFVIMSNPCWHQWNAPSFFFHVMVRVTHKYLRSVRST